MEGAYHDVYDGVTGALKPKCEYEEHEYLEDGPTPDNYHVDLARLRRKRTVQNKLVEVAVRKMFSTQTIDSLVDVLFKDMNNDYKIYADQGQEEEAKAKPEKPGADEDENQEERPEGDSEEEDEKDPTKYGVDIEAYMEVKGVLYIEKIKDIVGEIMGSCQKTLKYGILEYIMKGVIFEKKKLRESFMQEILNAADNAAYRQALQYYLNQNGMTVQNSWPLNNPMAGKVKRQERIIVISFVDCNITVLDRPE